MKIRLIRKFNSKFLLAIASFAFFLGSCTSDLIDNGDSDGTVSEITGTWKVDETILSGPSTSYQVTIASGSGDNQIVISNFFNLGKSVAVSCNVTGTSIVIPQQTSDGYVISGSGVITSTYKQITLNYSADDGNDPFTVTNVLTRPSN
jgi:hypothetical protein